MKALLITATSLMVIGSVSLADNSTNNELSMPVPQMGNWQVDDPVGAWPFISAGLGYADHNDTVRTEGAPTNVKLLGSYFFENRKIVSDLGIGLNSHFLSQNGNGSDVIFAPSVGIAGRYRFANGWQAGPTVDTFVGTDRYKSVNGDYTSFIGAQVLKQMTYKNAYLVRAGGKLMTDTDVKGENVNMAMLEIAVGFVPERRGASLTQSERKQAVQVASGRNIPIRMEPKKLEMSGFEISSAELTPAKSAQIRQVAQILKNNTHLFERVQVVGHADPTGPDRINDQLGLKRAETVAQALIRSGLSENQVQAVSVGANQPVSQSREADALAMSRRVEIRFIGVTDQEKLNELLNQ